ncbi:putative conserved membrane protein [Synechococcus sp. BIOS-U3-1]|uniref:hypothetical protein n=1 Tax=Synechococcus sp. BIOS-U3-1 TaxID=1400865 RepID=UPI00186125D7|nr:putative conserved membrane protein [Synechococcus sp. BIOS-U3-1]
MDIAHSHLLDLEKQARRTGSGLTASDLLGCWQLNTIWPKGQTEASVLNGWLLRSIGACLEIRGNSDDGLQLRNAVNLSGLTLQFTGPGELNGRQPLLKFRFEQVELLLGRFTLLKRELPSPQEGREPFFALIKRSPEGWMAARGRGGGLAFWTLRD